ncbi:HRDC domain-containing protein [Paenibacillus sp. SC116]|uniref:HRDC domain-containing protein n=1 Tax=Paenibacillus sp. SC116 TaxID=2968986 RepID=UPI00215A5058|nr:HRDC domain-containing protein [Paenibacillus sp. SC116]MCR8843791.1 HRDC domain-containing protein [Paenibacillus sp. SC116]
MIIVWMSRLEKTEVSGQVRSGLVTVGEEEGKWLVLWEQDGEWTHDTEDANSTWYEGEIWAEMCAALRRGVASLMRKGYEPTLGFTPDTQQHERRMKERNEWIHCFGDLNVDDELYHKLVQWRKEVASSIRRAPYWITTNRMLRLVSAFVPQTLEELKQLPGFGEAKVHAYGEAIIAITAPIPRRTTFPLDWVSAAVGPAAFLQWVYQQEEQKMSGELNRLVEKRTLIDAVQQRLEPEVLMERLNVDRRELLVRIEALSEEGYDMMSYADHVLSEIDVDIRSRIEDSLQEMGMDYLKPIYIQIFGQEALKEASAVIQRRYEYIRLVRMQLRNFSRKEQGSIRSRSTRSRVNVEAKAV